jgi:very-short-patch-repair endonuclease
MDLTRNCPECEQLLAYKSKQKFKFAIKNNKICRKCVLNKIRPTGPLSDETKEKIRRSNGVGKEHHRYGTKQTEITRNKLKEARAKQSPPTLGMKLGPMKEEMKEKLRKINTGKKHSELTKLKMSLSKQGEKNHNYGKSIPIETKQKISTSHKGKIISRHTRDKMSRSHIGKKLTTEIKNKLRVKANARLTKQYKEYRPNYNKFACELFNDINHYMKWNGQHAENGGEYYIKELGYWLDYYEPTINIVIEYDEPHHKYMIEKDKERQEQIEKNLSCIFIRLNESNRDSWKDVLNEYD